MLFAIRLRAIQHFRHLPDEVRHLVPVGLTNLWLRARYIGTQSWNDAPLSWVLAMIGTDIHRQPLFKTFPSIGEAPVLHIDERLANASRYGPFQKRLFAGKVRIERAGCDTGGCGKAIDADSIEAVCSQNWRSGAHHRLFSLRFLIGWVPHCDLQHSLDGGSDHRIAFVMIISRSLFHE